MFVNVEDVPEKPTEKELTLEKLTDSDDHWTFDCGSTGFTIARKTFQNNLNVPEPGAKILTWGEWGQRIRGVAIDGKVLFYHDEEHASELHQEWCDKKDAKEMETFLAEKDSIDARIKALPTEFQVRFEGYHKAGGDKWRAAYEPYELYCCEEAMKVVNHLKTSEKIREYWGMEDYKAQQKISDEIGLDDGHSGNTFGHSLKLATAFLENPELVDKVPSGMSPIVGSDEAHDWMTRPGSKDEIKQLEATIAAKKEAANEHP